MCEVAAYVEHPYSVIYEVPNKVGASLEGSCLCRQ